MKSRGNQTASWINQKWAIYQLGGHLPVRNDRRYVRGTVARGREGVRNTSRITQKRQARGVAHLGLHRGRRMPQVGTSLPEVWV